MTPHHCRFVMPTLISIAVAALSGCGGPSSPADAIEAYAEALDEGDAQAAGELLCAEKQGRGVAEEDLATWESYDISVSSIDETSAIEDKEAKVKVYFSSSTGPENETVTVVDEDGWKLCEGLVS